MTRPFLAGYDVAVVPAPAASTPLRTDIAGFAGRAARGPVGSAYPVRDFAEFTRVFGPARVTEGHLAHAVDGYFRNGGDLAYVVRVLGAGARPATGVLRIGREPPITATATSPGDWADDLRVLATRRTIDGGRTAWTVSARPVGADEEVTRAAELADAAGRIRLVRFDLPNRRTGDTVPSGPVSVAWPASGDYPARLSGGDNGATVGEEDYRAAVQPLLEQPEIALLVLPDLWDDLGPAGYGFAGSLAGWVHATLDRMLLLDLPASANESTAAALAAIALLQREIGTPRARAVAVYHPWLVIAEPGGRADAAPLRVPPGGHVAGLVSRLDRERGPSRTPANAPLVDVVDVAGGRVPVSQFALVEQRVNPIRGVPGRGLQVWGGRTFDAATDARFLAHRRLSHRLIRAARRAAEPLVFEPDGPPLHLALTRAVSTVLLEAYRSGALLGRSPDEAFAVATTSVDGLVVCEIGFAPAAPMEFITVRLTLGPEGRLEVIER